MTAVAREALARHLGTDAAHDVLARRRQSSRRRGWLVRRALAIADVLGLTSAFALAESLFPISAAEGVQAGWEVTLFVVTTLPVWVVAGRLYGLYDRDEERAHHTTTDDLAGVFQLTTLGAWLFVVAVWTTGVGDPDLSRVIAFWALAILLVSLARLVARAVARRLPSYVQNTVIVGAGDVGQLVARKLLQHPEYGINLLGFVDAEPKPLENGLAAVPVLGRLDDLPGLVSLLDVERVVFAFSRESRKRMVEIVRVLQKLDVQVDMVPRFFEVVGSRTSVHAIEGLALVGIPPIRLPRSSRLVKRAMDVAIAGLALVVIAPLLVLIALVVRLDSKGPVLFRQARMGAGDRSFEILKFRTMVADADARKHEVRHLNETGDPRLFKARRDPRVTRAGRVLRRLSLDELPQLVNVVRGDMSLVGPRPLPLDEDANITDWGRRRLDLRPGITGLWQVLGRSDIPFDEMLRLDYVYVTGWSLWSDVRIILRTFPILLGRSGGAY
jgi:exopolysaccharide biosynthesis polyprenyl glycosylphosphotransferase